MKYDLPKLNYAYNALEPVIDAETMEIHHAKHHQAYINSLNTVLGANLSIADKPLPDLIRELGSLPISEADKTKLKNHGGGHLNHTLFWQLMDPASQKNEALAKEIETAFGSAEEFKKLFSQAATGHFGSGWAWLARDENNKLQVYSLPNQDSPYLRNHTPLIGLDVWEHAYYLKHQNRRPEYIENWWKIIKFI